MVYNRSFFNSEKNKMTQEIALENRKKGLTTSLASVGLTIKTKTPFHLIEGHTDGINSLALSADGRTLFTASSDTAHAWDVATGHHLRTFDGHSRSVNALALSADARTLFTASSDKTARAWDVATARPFKIFEGHTDEINSLALSADGRTLFTGSSDKTARAWDVATGRQTMIFEMPGQLNRAIALSAYGCTLFTSAVNNVAYAWNVATGQQIKIFKKNEPIFNISYALALSTDGRTLFTGGIILKRLKRSYKLYKNKNQKVSTKRGAIAWDVATGLQFMTFEGHTSVIKALALSANGQTLFTGSSDHTASAWDVATGRQLRIFEGHTGGISVLALSGRSLFTGSEDGTVRVWNAQTGEHLATLYHIKKGFLWTAPPDEASKTGWFWTDRLERVSVLKADEEDSNCDVLANDEQECPEDLTLTDDEDLKWFEDLTLTDDDLEWFEDQNDDDDDFNREGLADDDQERLDYIRDHNRQDIVMSRINDPEKYQRLINYFTDKKETQALENKIKENRYRLSYQKK